VIGVLSAGVTALLVATVLGAGVGPERPAPQPSASAVAAGPAREPLVEPSTTVPPTTAAPAPGPTAGSARSTRLGTVGRWGNGMQMTVVKADHRPRPGASSIHMVGVEVRLHNRGEVPFDPRRAVVSLQFGPGRKAADLLERDRLPASLGPEAQILREWEFLVPRGDVDALRVRVAPGPGFQPLVFQGAAVPD
jgi:hypothetical protein